MNELIGLGVGTLTVFAWMLGKCLHTLWYQTDPEELDMLCMAALASWSGLVLFYGCIRGIMFLLLGA